MKTYRVKINGKTYNVQLEAIEETTGTVTKEKTEVKEKVVSASTKEGEAVVSPIQGNLLNVLVKEGQQVKKGDVLVIIEAMKLENEVNAPRDCEIVEVCVDKGQTVSSDQVLVKIK